MNGDWEESSDLFDDLSYWDNPEFKRKLLASPLSKLYIKKSQPLLQRLQDSIIEK